MSCNKKHPELLQVPNPEFYPDNNTDDEHKWFDIDKEFTFVFKFRFIVDRKFIVLIPSIAINRHIKGIEFSFLIFEFIISTL